MVTFSLILIGALNWGLVGLFNFSLVTAVLGGYPNIEKIVYVLVGASAVYEIVTHKSSCKLCVEKGK